jgi:CTP synthase (UTP-ammonia lyase)
MSKAIQVAIIGDFNPNFSHHVATDESLKHAAAFLAQEVEPRWIFTDTVKADPARQLEEFDAIWCSSGSPYRSMEGALFAIRFAREKSWPFFAT